MPKVKKKARKSPATTKLSETSLTVLRLVQKYPDSIPYKLWRHARQSRIEISQGTIEDEYHLLDGYGLIRRPDGLSIFGMRFLMTPAGEEALKTGRVRRDAKPVVSKVPARW